MLGSATASVVLMALITATMAHGGSDDYQHEKDPVYWRRVAQMELETSLNERTLTGVAKNVILFLGDGMGPTTVTAGRILAGQVKGKKGEEVKLSFDEFPNTGLSKTYNVNTQVTDSAASGTAYLTGVKTNQGVLGVNARANRSDCASARDAHVDSILRWSAKAGKSTGIVTTTRVTHATPAASYAHTPERDWESDREVPPDQAACEDIALQLVTRNSDINVIMGGGRAYFYPEGFDDPNPDPAFNTSAVSRTDNRNLVDMWKSDKEEKGFTHQFVHNTEQLRTVDPERTDYLLGLFTQGHMSYDIERDPQKEPSLAEMTEMAIQILRKNENGFFLLVEGGRIDHGHHASMASKALHDVISMADAVHTATEMTQKEDTLIVVTADHSHTMTIAGYAKRGNSILGKADDGTPDPFRAITDHMPYTTIQYANGPGSSSPNPRLNISLTDTDDKDYVQQSTVPRKSETHGGEDVAIYARGPYSHLYTGVHEQNYIPMVMAFASCVGSYEDKFRNCAKYYNTIEIQTRKGNNSATAVLPYSLQTIVTVSILFYYGRWCCSWL